MTALPPFDLDFPRAHGDPVCTGMLRSCDADFQVDELLGVELKGEGEHLYLQIEKQGQNTQWLAGQLARAAGVRPMDVGYAGLKDRHAITRQWFSLWLPGKESPDLQGLDISGVRVLQQSRHDRKLKRGGHLGNRFVLRLREVAADDALEVRLRQVRDRGVPNYYGEQRFGIDGGNLPAAEQLLSGERRVKDRNRRGLLLSAARSYLFNQLVAERVRRGNWNTYLDGDRLMVAGSSNLLSLEDSRAREADVGAAGLHPTAPLWGRGRALAEGAALALETDILAPFSRWCEGLERAGLSRERRALGLLPEAMRWHWPEPGVLEISFCLPPGTFATSVLRECCAYRVAERNNDETTAIQR
ncbi:tRNA pseudouridine(13) synthase TruD [Motiliproteus sediminis]|uniref:tRNA pseudouridine(13) synthase TruD n=1 Tax=Motiliproteus sediminis TaxID=1468178 RepID=UPI001AEF623C|nr:tRNA pseudouridine(13) synthase TruD [Motiliproteus sediminis]